MVSPSALRPADERETLFDGIYEAHRQTLHAYLLGRTSDAELALDLLQEAFVRAWRNLDTLVALPAPRQRAWLFATGRNLVIDQYRARATRAAAHDALTAEIEHDAPVSESAEQTVERASEVHLVEAAMHRLPLDLRTLLVLQVLGDHTSAEIGEMLGRPAGTVRYQLSRARKLLADELRLLEAGPDPPPEAGRGPATHARTGGVTVSTDHPARARRLGDRLDSLLARWADAHRLTPRQTEAIHQRIVAERPSDDFDWWWRLLDPDGGTAFTGMAATAAWGSSAIAYGATSQPTEPWLAGASSLPTWDHDIADFQPYLRLT